MSSKMNSNVVRHVSVVLFLFLMSRATTAQQVVYNHMACTHRLCEISHVFAL